MKLFRLNFLTDWILLNSFIMVPKLINFEKSKCSSFWDCLLMEMYNSFSMFAQLRLGKMINWFLMANKVGTPVQIGSRHWNDNVGCLLWDCECKHDCLIYLSQHRFQKWSTESQKIMWAVVSYSQSLVCLKFWKVWSNRESFCWKLKFSRCFRTWKLNEMKIPNKAITVDW